MSKPRLTPEEQAQRGGRNVGILKDYEKEKYIELILQGYDVNSACGVIRRGNMTVRQTRKTDPEFDKAVIKALKDRVVTHVENSCVRLATGDYEVITEHYVPVLDSDKKPMIGPDGKAVIRLASKTVRKPAPSLAAQKLFLKGNCPDTYGSLKLNVGVGEVSPTLDHLTKDQLENLINEKAQK